MIRRLLHLDVEYRVGNVWIRLPPDHLLPIYQLLHKRYDRFLPHLAGYLEHSAVVVDVGANCGDTIAAMYSANPGLHFECIEADAEFFRMLEKNVERIRGVDSRAVIRLWGAFVGRNVPNLGLTGHGGTKRAIVEGDATARPALRTIAIDEIAATGRIERVTLLKSDVDGFDFDVIDSAASLIRRDSPILFFECDVRDAAQEARYAATFSGLQERGYRFWTAFDNFGEVILHTDQASTMVQLIGYVKRQRAGRTTRTMHYIDVLAGTDERRALLERVVSDYIA